MAQHLHNIRDEHELSAFIGTVSKPAQIPITELKKCIICTWKDVAHLVDIFDHRGMIIPPKRTALLTHIRLLLNILNNSSSCFELNATNEPTFKTLLSSSEGDSQQLTKGHSRGASHENRRIDRIQRKSVAE